MNTRNPRRTNAAPAVQPADRAIPHPVIPELERVDAPVSALAVDADFADVRDRLRGL